MPTVDDLFDTLFGDTAAPKPDPQKDPARDWWELGCQWAAIVEKCDRLLANEAVAYTEADGQRL